MNHYVVHLCTSTTLQFEKIKKKKVNYLFSGFTVQTPPLTFLFTFQAGCLPCSFFPYYMPSPVEAIWTSGWKGNQQFSSLKELKSGEIHTHTVTNWGKYYPWMRSKTWSGLDGEVFVFYTHPETQYLWGLPTKTQHLNIRAIKQWVHNQQILKEEEYKEVLQLWETVPRTIHLLRSKPTHVVTLGIAAASQIPFQPSAAVSQIHH